MFLIGTYQLGWRWVEVFANLESFGGTFNMNNGTSGDLKHAKITVGFKSGSCFDCFEVLTHEAMEFLFSEHNVQFSPSHAYAPYASDAYHFMFDHNVLTEVAAKLGHFLWDIRKDFEAAHELLKVEEK